MSSVSKRNLLERWNNGVERYYINDAGVERYYDADRILLHLNTEGDGTPEISPEIEEPVDILYKIGDIKRECSSYDFMGTRGGSFKNEERLLGEFPNNSGSIKKYHWLHTLNADSEDATTYMIAQLENGNFIYLVASMGGMLSEFYGTEDGDWQFGYLYVSNSREELIEKCMTEKEYSLYIKTTSFFDPV
jgi:hypothetical protein